MQKHMSDNPECFYQGRTDHLETWARPGVRGPMRCPWYLFHRLF
ncbi:unnamed protein product [Staurois parvus]|uniref:Uncharacterized protein n=1 Tax=Staurois parvus TaxID=386267 RepID=A0ABN9BC70_9NEOB|nr:unnamed protein product [Staurois parvus]